MNYTNDNYENRKVPTYKKRAHQSSLNLKFSFLILLIVMILTFSVLNIPAKKIKKNEESSMQAATTTTVQAATTTATDTADTTTDNTTSSNDDTTAADTTTADENNSSFDAKTFYKTAVFIGDSRTQGFQMHSGITKLGATVYAHQGLALDEISSLAFVNDNGTSKTVYDALKGKNFKSIFVMQGLNELGWPYIDTFISKYTEYIQKLKQLQPDATIYVQSVLEVTKSRSSQGDAFTKKQVDAFNARIKKMCKSEKVKYIDLNTDLCDADGYLKNDYASDGIHLTKSGYEIWLKELNAYFKKQ